MTGNAELNNSTGMDRNIFSTRQGASSARGRIHFSAASIGSEASQHEPYEVFSDISVKYIADFLRDPQRLLALKKAPAALAVALFAPESREIRDTYRELLDSGAEPEKDLKLRSMILFPQDREAAELYFQKHECGVILTQKDEISLYIKRESLFTDRSLAETTREIEGLLRNFEIAESEESQAESLKTFVLREIEIGALASSDKTLQSLFNVNQKQLDHLMRIVNNGLGAKHRKLVSKNYRNDHEYKGPAFERALFHVRVIHGIRTLIHVENKIHQFKPALIKNLSRSEDLAKLFQVSKYKMDKHLRQIFREDRHYRFKISTKPGPHDSFDEVKESIRNMKPGEYECDTKIAKRYGLLPVTVNILARNSIRPELIDRRNFALKDCKEDLHRRSPIVFVQQEIEAFEKQEVHSLATNEKLAELFNTTPEIIAEELKKEAEKEEGGLLTIKQLNMREFIHKLGGQSSAMTEIFSKALTMQVIERIGTEAMRNVTKAYNTTMSGIDFDSKEEAIAGHLMQHFIKDMELKKGESYQIEIDRFFIDFRLPDQRFIEYHGIIPRAKHGDFYSYEEEKAYDNELKLAGKADLVRMVIKDDVRERLRERYDSRRETIINSQGGEDCLTVVTNLEELYFQVISPYTEAQGDHVSFTEFKFYRSVFYDLLNSRKF